MRETSYTLLQEQRPRTLEEQLGHVHGTEAMRFLAGSIAHDFNNVLTGILGNLQLTEMDLPRSHPAHDSLQASIKACQLGCDLVARIVSISHPSQDGRAQESQ